MKYEFKFTDIFIIPFLLPCLIIDFFIDKEDNQKKNTTIGNMIWKEKK